MGASYPGMDLLWLLVAALLLVAFGVVWLLRLVLWLRREDGGPAGRWLIAPVMVLTAFGLVATDVPLRARFQAGRDDFEVIVSGLDAQGTFERWASLDVPDRAGSYEIIAGQQVGDNVILHVAFKGFDDAGFAYLPDGPDARFANAGFERPRFRSIGEDWYAWTASW